MASISLSDQMGAMSLIDEIRHRKLAIREYLDLPEQRKEVARRIREFYESRAIKVDDQLIDDGVKAYFANRLSFEAPKVGFVARALSGMYIDRRDWYFRFIAVAVFVGVSLVFVQALSLVAEKEAQKSVVEFSSARDGFTAEIGSQKALVEHIQKMLAGMNFPAANRLLASAEKSIGSFEERMSGIPVLVYQEGRSNTLNAQSESGIASLSSFYEDVRSNKSRLQNIDDLIQKKIQLDKFSAENRPYALARLKVLDAEAHQALDASDSIGMEAADGAISALYSAYSNLNSIQELARQRDGIARQFASMKLDKEDRSIISAEMDRAQIDLAAMDYPAASRDVAELGRLLSFAITPFKVLINDQHSGIERTYRSDGKAWYLIAEAISQTGDAVPMKIVDAESGKWSTVKKFAVRVTHFEYLKVKADKKQDGHVDERQIGEKPSGSLTIRYDNLTKKRNPQMLTGW